MHNYAQMALLRGCGERLLRRLPASPLGARLERVANRPRLEWKEIKPAERLRGPAGALPTWTIEQRQRVLADLLIVAKFPHTPAARRGGPWVAARRIASKTLKSDRFYALMIRSAGELVPELNTDVAEATWRMCSGLAHGDFSVSIDVLDTKGGEQLQPGIKLVRASVSVGSLLYATATALEIISHAFALIRLWSTPPY